MTHTQLLNKYAQLLIGLGINLQKGDYLLLDIDVENYELAREITDVAMKRGAKDVIIHYSDPFVERSIATYGEKENLAEISPWMQDSYKVYIEEGACSLRVIGTYPTVFEDVDTERAVAIQSRSNTTRNYLRKGTAEKGMHWCIACAATYNWAEDLFPELDKEEALAKLWDTLFKICLIDETSDPLENWSEDKKKSGRFSEFINSHDLKEIHFKNGIGTDFTVGFMPDVFWVGGDTKGFPKGFFLPNIPAMEVSSSPNKYEVNGTVVATRPLMENGKIIDGYGFTFKDGKVVDYYANEGLDVLEDMLNKDEGAKYLGEVAFVPCDSPIAQTGLMFKNTLLDENAGCHLALGRGFNILHKGLSGTDIESWKDVNLNYSQIHVDFVFGSPDMEAVMTMRDGTTVKFFENGKFCI